MTTFTINRRLCNSIFLYLEVTVAYISHAQFISIIRADVTLKFYGMVLSVRCASCQISRLVCDV
jgi:hypothetical protein